MLVHAGLRYAPLWLAGLLGAGIMAAVMASDSQILALSTMFTEDVFAFYGGTARFGEAVQVQTGRLFVVLLTVAGLPDRAARAAEHLRSRRAVRVLRLRGAVAAAGRGAVLEAEHEVGRAGGGAVGRAAVIYTARVPGALAWFGLMPVVPMTLISCVLMIVVSLATPPPSSRTLARYRVVTASSRRVPEVRDLERSIGANEANGDMSRYRAAC